MTTARETWLTGVLAVGFLAAGVAAIAAHGDPATGFELSIYESTTPTFWVLSAVAMTAALLAGFHARDSRALRAGAVGLGAVTILSIAMLPLLRGYFFYGSADSLSHLGWARQMAGQVPNAPLSPTGLLYPGIHATGVAIAGVTGVPMTRALLYVVLVYTLVFVVFVPLCVRELADDRLAVVAGAFSALLLLPINNVSVFNMPYPTGQGIYLFPVLVLLVVLFVVPDGTGSRGLRWGSLLAVVSFAVILLHPIVAVPALLLLATISGVQYAYRRWEPSHRIASHRALYANTAFLAVAFFLWSQRFERVQRQQVILVEGLFFGGEPVGDEITMRAGSLAALGSGITELYVKIFLVATAFAVLAGLLGLASVLGRIDDDRTDRAALVKYLSVGTVPIVAAFFAFFIASLSVLPFRFLGVIMVLVTILGAVAIADGLPFSPSRPSGRAIRRVVVVVFIVAMALQMAHVHQSPYIYRGSSQVTEQEYVGHEIAFEHTDPDVWWAGPRGGPEWYLDAIYGTSFNDTTPGGLEFTGARTAVPYDVFGNNMTEFYGHDRYVGVSRGTIQKEVGLYDGFRYSREEFAAVETTPGIHRIQSNGEFWLYYVGDAS